MELNAVTIENPDGLNLILGQSHFIKTVPEVCRIFCATANPIEVVVAETAQGRGILGVIDGFASKGIETDDDIHHRKDLLRRFGYKLG